MEVARPVRGRAKETDRLKGQHRASVRSDHTCVALLIAKGAQQYEVMEHLGHTNIQTTINTYGHLFPNVRERIRVALEDTWDEGHRSAG